MKTPPIARILTIAIVVSCPSLIASGPPQQSRTAKSSNSSSSSPSTSSSSKAKSTSKKKKTGKRRSAKREPFQKAPTPERISEIQSALARGGYYQGSPNGKWDADTVGALQKFQTDNGMNASGKIDALSLQKLGLGSSTAGVDAPKPISHRTPSATLTSSATPPAGNPTTAVNTSASTVATSATASSASAPSTSKPPQK